MLMLTKKDCVGFLDEAVRLIGVMRETLDVPAEEAPRVFFEAYTDAQQQLSSALRAALAPALDGGDSPAWIPGGDWTPNDVTLQAIEDAGKGRRMNLEAATEMLRALEAKASA
jgi:hypothetical protein